MDDKIKVGLRIDVDTLRGTKKGVPRLLQILEEHSVYSTFFFSVGPDNMGRHLRRLIRPDFLWKMLRTRAARLYGWDILLKGTLWPGPIIGERCKEIIAAAATNGHEIGLHAWDHHLWQTKIAAMAPEKIAAEIEKGQAILQQITGKTPSGFAAPAWWCPPSAQQALENAGFCYRSDCRGETPFYPLVPEKDTGKMKFSATPQLPVTLPTYDELIGIGCSDKNYNETLLAKIRTKRFHILTIHAEVEGIACARLFHHFLTMAKRQGISFCPLIELLEEIETLPYCALLQKKNRGREGLLSWQGDAYQP